MPRVAVSLHVLRHYNVNNTVTEKGRRLLMSQKIIPPIRRGGVMPDVGLNGINGNGTTDVDVEETREWLDSLESVVQNAGPDRATYLLSELKQKAHRAGIALPFTANTPYVNTIPPESQPVYPGN